MVEAPESAYEGDELDLETRATWRVDVVGDGAAGGAGSTECGSVGSG